MKLKTNMTPEQMMDPQLPLKVMVWTSKKEYKTGESIEIFVRGNQDSYARVVDITSSGDIIQLLPNAYRKDNFFKAGVTYKIPDKGDAFELKVTPPYGEDNVMVYASEVPLGGVELESIGQGLSRYRGLKSDLATQSRGISMIGTGADKTAGAEFYEATWSLKTSQ